MAAPTTARSSTSSGNTHSHDTHEVEGERRIVLIATDFSAPSVTAIDWAARHLVQHGDRILILNTIQESLAAGVDIGDLDVYTMSDTVANDSLMASAQTAMTEWSNHMKERTANKDKIKISTDIAFGPPGPTIVSKAKEHDADMVVVGTHGRTGLEGLILGSVSQYVSKHCTHCPVVLVRGNPHSSKTH